MLQQRSSKFPMCIHSFNLHNNPQREVTLRSSFTNEEYEAQLETRKFESKASLLNLYAILLLSENQYLHLCITLYFSPSFLLDSLMLFQTKNYFLLKSIFCPRLAAHPGGCLTLLGRLGVDKNTSCAQAYGEAAGMQLSQSLPLTGPYALFFGRCLFAQQY